MDDVTQDPAVETPADEVVQSTDPVQEPAPAPFGTPHTLVDKVKAELHSMAQYLGVEYDHVKQIFVNKL